MLHTSWVSTYEDPPETHSALCLLPLRGLLTSARTAVTPAQQLVICVEVYFQRNGHKGSFVRGARCLWTEASHLHRALR